MYEACRLIEAEGYTGWGNCLAGAVGGDPVLLTFLLLGILAFIGYKLNFPKEVSVTMGIGIIFMMALFSGITMYPVFILMVILVAFIVAKAVIKIGRS